MTPPTFSIVIPTYAREEQLRRCLDAIGAIDYPADAVEVVVVDDGSPVPPDPPPTVGPFDVSLIRQANLGPAAARNTGARAAGGQYLAFTDDDCEPDRSWLREFAECLADQPESGFGGRTINRLEQNPYATASQLLIDYLYDYYNHGGRQPRFFTTSNLVLPAAPFLRLGGFDESFRRAGGEDREMCDRWVEAGLDIDYAPEAVVHHTNPLTLRQFWRQHFNYGCGAHTFHTIRYRRGQGTLQPEPARFYSDLVLYPFRSGNRGGVTLSALLALSQAANAAGYFTTRARAGTRSEPPISGADR